MTRIVACWFSRWLMNDRIRISPNEGNLLRLQVGQRVILGNELWVISSRQDCLAPFPIGVRYHLVSIEVFTEYSIESPMIIGEDEVSKTIDDAGTCCMDCYL